MTREEINILQDIVDLYEKEDMYPLLKDRQIRTIKLAIKALEQEPCEDAVSRQAVLKAIDKWYENNNQLFLSDCVEDLIIAINYELPSVQPKLLECEDAVSRQDAIKAMYDLFDVENNEIMTIPMIADTIDEWINALPSVQPKAKTGCCKECQYFEYDSAINADNVPIIYAHEICSKWGDGCKTSENGYCFMFEQKGGAEMKDGTE